MDANTELSVFFAGLRTGQLVSVKLNLDHDEEEEWEEDLFDKFDVFRRFLTDKYGNVLYSSVGKHLGGKNGKPHIHFHYVLDSSYKSITSQARSNLKARWCKDEEPRDVILMRRVSFAFTPFDGAKNTPWSFLSYPLKEGYKVNTMDVYIGLTSRILGFLLSVGTTIYETSRAIQERNEKAIHRQIDALDELYKFALEYYKKEAFTTFREMQLFFENFYLKQKVAEDGIHALPDPANYNRNLKKVGFALGVFRFCDDSSAK